MPIDELFITTKLTNSEQGYDKTLSAFDASMAKLGIEVLDLFLIHWPLPMFDLYVDTWRAFEKLQADGRIRSIGVSNFEIEHLERLATETGTVPAVNQVELHPELPQAELRAYHAEHGIVTESWGPGCVVIPKSVTPDRIRDNLDVFDFELDETDLDRIADVETGWRLGPDPMTFDAR